MLNILISSFDMEIGGVERSLISMLNNFDYDNYKIDLMLYSHTGDFMNFLPKGPNLLEEDKNYKTFRMSIKDVFKCGKIKIGLARILAKLKANRSGEGEIGYIQMQYMWKYALTFLPNCNKKYDVAISYLWPHYYVAEKVRAKKKIAWIHTDYSVIKTDVKLDLEMWNKFDYIMAVSEECKNSFIKKYPSLIEKVKVMENITSPEFIKERAKESIENYILQDKSFKLVSVARLSHAKGIDNAVKALRILHDRGFTNIKWYVVGYGGDEDLIRNLIKENNLEKSFILLGKRTNPYPYMKIADIYVQPSRYEGKAVTVTEARILGRPTIITNYPTAKSQLTDGVDGIICESSIDGIAKSIEDLYKNYELREKININCKNINYGNTYELEKLYKLFK
ncbi:glycosyltransferase [Clostridium perfringens]|uniref:glycosyltransferase n=1 Tax=Clostridium perfringens TaxID=1502 RepID=UPI000E145F47|nr:glycosyltransferase [Clostridium perfringens]MDM0500693.1 glycosyltransferase [Clostridium perfringens]MDM0703841.1 glycosyltransferase [Clostridium perfringens]SUY38081.1 capsular polysaccharide biosynthsis protein [Clostridium perfringens]